MLLAIQSNSCKLFIQTNFICKKFTAQPSVISQQEDDEMKIKNQKFHLTEKKLENTREIEMFLSDLSMLGGVEGAATRRSGDLTLRGI